jgi:hypothetical protein
LNLDVPIEVRYVDTVMMAIADLGVLFDESVLSSDLRDGNSRNWVFVDGADRVLDLLQQTGGVRRFSWVRWQIQNTGKLAADLDRGSEAAILWRAKLETMAAGAIVHVLQPADPGIAATWLEAARSGGLPSMAASVAPYVRERRTIVPDPALSDIERILTQARRGQFGVSEFQSLEALMRSRATPASP